MAKKGPAWDRDRDRGISSRGAFWCMETSGVKAASTSSLEHGGYYMIRGTRGRRGRRISLCCDLRSPCPCLVWRLAAGSRLSLGEGEGDGRWEPSAQGPPARDAPSTILPREARWPIRALRARPSPSSGETTIPLARAAPPRPSLRWLQPHQPLDSVGCFSGAAFCGLQLCSTPPSTCPALPKTAKLQPPTPVFQPHAASNPVV